MLSPSQPPADPAVVSLDAARRPSAPVRGPIRLPAPRRTLVYAAGLATWSTGVLWLLFHYFLRREGTFGPEAHSLEPWWLKLHGAASFLILWTFGLLWGIHIVNGWNSRRRRWTGGLLFGLVALLIVTGYLLYYAGDERLRETTSVVHWTAGLIAPAAFVWHRYLAGERR